MDINRGRSVCLLVIMGIIVHCVVSESQVCHVQERLNMGLSKIEDPAQILSVGYESQSAPDCYNTCCNFTENKCNAVSFFDKEKLCMLLSCRPFSNCVWVTADGFAAARIQMTSAADDAQPQSPGNPMTSSTTSQKPTTPEALADWMMPITTTTTTTTTTQATITTTPSAPGGFQTSITQALNPDTSFNSAQTSATFDSATSSDFSDWNMNGEDSMSSAAATTIGLLTTVKPDSAEQTTAAPAFQASSSSSSNPDSDFLPEQPVTTNTGEDEGFDANPRVLKRMFIQSPGIIIGLCSALGVAFLVLLAVCRKVYLSQDGPRYKPLRDYDIRFEPPAASSALLP